MWITKILWISIGASGHFLYDKYLSDRIIQLIEKNNHGDDFVNL